MTHRPRELDIATRTAFWVHFGLPGVSIRYVVIRDVAGKFDPQALLSTDLTFTPEQILAFFRRPWQMEPTFRHVREHLGVETQRQWSTKAVARTTPLSHELLSRHNPTIRNAAWYPKPLSTFSGALVRHSLWAHLTFQMSQDDADMVNVPRVLLDRFHDLLCYTT